MAETIGSISVSMAGLKKNISGSFDELVDLINESDRIDSWGFDVIQIEKMELIKKIQYLRAGISTLCYSFVEDEGNPEFFPVVEWNSKLIKEEANEDEE